MPPEGQRPAQCPDRGHPHSDRGVQPLENTALSWGTIGKSACRLTDITIRKSQVILPRIGTKLCASHGPGATMPIDARSTQGACMIPNHLRRTARLVLAAGVLLSAPGRVGAGDDAVFRPHRQRERRPGRRSQPAGRHHGRPDEHRRGGCRP
jgi:hypothetical protein